MGSLGKSWGETARRYAAPHGWDEPPGTAPVSPLRTAPVPPLAQETWPTRLTRIYPHSSIVPGFTKTQTGLQSSHPLPGFCGQEIGNFKATLSVLS